MSGIAVRKHASYSDSSVSPSSFTARDKKPLSVFVGVTDVWILETNFLASPCVAAADPPRQVILMRGRGFLGHHS
jgi:hypothetical protein